MLDYAYVVFMPPGGYIYRVYVNGEFCLWEPYGNAWSPIYPYTFLKTNTHGTVPDLYLVLKGIPDGGR